MFPKYEDAKAHGDQAFAITINPENQFYGDPERAKKVVQRLRKQLAWEHCSYELHMEISPLGRIHFHGIIRIRQGCLKRFYCNMIPDLIGASNHAYRNTVVMEIMKEGTLYDGEGGEGGWANYCEKQQFCPTMFYKSYAPAGIQIYTTIHDYYDD